MSTAVLEDHPRTRQYVRIRRSLSVADEGSGTHHGRGLIAWKFLNLLPCVVIVDVKGIVAVVAL